MGTTLSTNRGTFEAFARTRELAITILSFVPDTNLIVGPAAGILLRLLGTFEAVRTNKNGFMEIIYRAAMILYFLWRSRPTIPESPLTMGYLQAIQTFTDILEDISLFASLCAGRKWWGRLLRVRSDAEKISEYRRRLNDSLKLFKAQGHHTSGHSTSASGPGNVLGTNVQNLTKARQRMTETLQRMKKDEIKLNQLGSDISYLVDFVIAHVNDADQRYTLEQLELLYTIIKDVDAFAQKYGGRMWLGRYLHRRGDLRKKSAAESQLNELCKMDPQRK
ncbi:hypothetical protein BDN72DRAFT_897843 [Pluteus cervinus]|uniref:Uncharacterized protein n=1 Tax=Pluteus cervinus TaxID=181527 RepID=A0ACD3AT91_9AGAR|nr:hypothetical protein BDN72DRAFT_897843 [Pluteus cervinus]